MKTLKELREARNAAYTKAQAIIDIAGSESRDLTADEKSTVDAVMGVGKVGEPTYKAGVLDQIDIEIARAEKIEARQAEIAGKMAQATYRGGQSADGEVRIEAIDRQRHGRLAGFASKREAFVAGAWAAATLLRNQRAAEFCAQIGIDVRGAMSGGDNGAVGFLVPETLERAIIRLVEDYGTFRANARVMPMATETVNIPRNTSGVTAYFVSEVPSSITASDLGFEMAQLQAKVMAVRTVISNDLLEDAIIDLGNLIATDAALKFAEKEDDCGFNGDGTSTYGGIVGLKSAIADGATKTAATGNTAFSTLDLADFEGMVGKLPSYARSGAKWYISQAGWADSMLRLLNAGGGNTMVDLGSGPRLSFLGYEVVVSQKMNSTLSAQTSTDGLVFLGRLDLAATVGVKRGIRVSVLRELYAATRQTGLIIDQRMDINVHERGTASVSGPVIMLSTPAS